MPHSRPGGSSGPPRTLAGRVLASCWWGAALIVGGTGIGIGLLTPGPWLASVGMLSALLGTMTATGIAGWRRTSLAPALIVRVVACWALGGIAMVGLGRLPAAGVVPVLGALALTAVPLVLLPAARRTLGANMQADESAAAGGARAHQLDPLATGSARHLDDFAHRDLPRPTGWLNAEQRWLDLINTGSTAGSTAGPPLRGRAA